MPRRRAIEARHGDPPFFALRLAASIAGAELLVRGASKLALAWGISPLVAGLTIVAFGTSSPELAVSVGAALGGTTDIAIGNAVGSNILNVLFILGVPALIAPLAVHALLLAAYRLLRGPAAPDRILALDTLYIDTMALLILLGIRFDTALYFEAALVTAMLGFVSTVVPCKFLLRGDIVE